MKLELNLTILLFINSVFAACSPTESNLSVAGKDTDGTDTLSHVDTDKDSDGVWDTDVDSEIFNTDSGGDGDADSDSDTDTDTEVNWPQPVQKQTGLPQFNLTCDTGDLTNDCNNTDSPCIPDDPKILCDLTITDVDQTVVYNGRIAIERRGRSSINYDKPNYSVEFRMADGVTDNPVPCLGMGKEADWVLDGAWLDRSFMRNDLLFDIYREIGGARYAPESRFGELSFNGNHQGIYRLVEKIKKDDDRIPIADDNGTGASFVIEQDEDGTLYADLGLEPSNDIWQMIYPRQDVATSAQRSGVQSWLSTLDSALSNGTVFTWLDMETTVDFVLLQEFTKNIDAYVLSIHFYKDLTGKAHLVPWDIDLSMGQPTLTNDWENTRNQFPEGFARHTEFLNDLLKDPAFKPALIARWNALRQGPLSNAYLDIRIDNYLAVLQGQAIIDNFNVWPIEDVDFVQIWNEYTLYDVTSYDQEIALWRQWMEDHLIWMDANIENFPG